MNEYIQSLRRFTKAGFILEIPASYVHALKTDKSMKGKEKREEKSTANERSMFTVRGIRSINRLAEKQTKKYAIIILNQRQSNTTF